MNIGWVGWNMQLPQNIMAEEQGQEIKVEPEDPEFLLEEHILFKRRQEALNNQLRRLFSESLSEFRLIMDGSSYAFTTLTLPNKGLTAVSEVVAEYAHLRNIDLNNNQISDTIHLQKLKYLVTLNLARNTVADPRFLSNPALFPYLKTLSLASNRLKALPALALCNLRHLNLNGNQIASLEDFDGHSVLEVLELRGNRISDLKGLQNSPSLRELYLGDNAITSLGKLARLGKLEKLHVRKNRISELSEFPDIGSIRYLNLRENQVGKVEQLAGVNKGVVVINLLGNPVSEELGENAKKEVWMRFRQYQKINKSEVTVQEREEFEKEYKERVAEKERVEKEERQAREQAEREALEKEQAQ